MTNIEQYYNKFNEEKRLDSRHGQVEYRVTMKYINGILADYEAKGRLRSDICILDLGAGTGRYSVPLADAGYDVTAVELVKYNLGILKKKNSTVKAMQGNALHLKKLQDESFDVTLLFGPMYHLTSDEDKQQALAEAKRVTRKDGTILVAYCMNEYSVIRYGFMERHIEECIENDKISSEFRVKPDDEDLYDYVRLEDIDRLNAAVGLERIKIISPDGPANYIRPFLNKLSEKEFEYFVEYQMATCERPELIGAGGHTVDILKLK